jgi:hypothetical protein
MTGESRFLRGIFTGFEYNPRKMATEEKEDPMVGRAKNWCPFLSRGRISRESFRGPEWLSRANKANQILGRYIESKVEKTKSSLRG